MKHVLVTGAGGFSGARIAERLVRSGYRVTATLASGRGRLPERLEATGRLTVVRGDLASEVSLPQDLDAVVHAAARSPGPGVTVARMAADNVVATSHLVRHARIAGTRCFIFLSSLSVYGSVEGPVVDEATPIVNPDAYGATKLLGEQLVAEGGDFRSIAIRLPGIIGKGSARNWLTGVLRKAQGGSEITVYNPEGLYNNAVHVEDLSAFIARLVEADWKGADHVTLGAGGVTTVRQAVETIVQGVHSAASIRVVDAARPGFVISSKRAVERYGYAPMDILPMIERFVRENAQPGDTPAAGD